MDQQPSGIRIDTGVKRIQINDGDQYLEFNPGDVAFAERFYRVMADFEIKYADYKRRAAELDKVKGKDAWGAPRNLKDGLAMMREVGEYVLTQIDTIFGVGTSKKVFGDAVNLVAIESFFTQITPFIKAARGARLDKYSPRGRGRSRKNGAVLR